MLLGEHSQEVEKEEERHGSVVLALSVSLLAWKYGGKHGFLAFAFCKVRFPEVAGKQRKYHFCFSRF